MVQTAIRMKPAPASQEINFGSTCWEMNGFLSQSAMRDAGNERASRDWVDKSPDIWSYGQVMPKLEGRVRGLMEARAKIMKALAHPTRLFIVDELSRGERCVCELTEMIGADISTVSKHLSVLKGAGIVRDDKRGSQVFYRLSVPCILNFFGCVEAVMAQEARERSAVAEAS